MSALLGRLGLQESTHQSCYSHKGNEMNTHDNEPNLENAELLFDSASGTYIPQRFAQEIVRELVKGVSEEDYAALENPDDEWYWDAWASVLDNAILTMPETGGRYQLYQDGDVWMIPMENET